MAEIDPVIVELRADLERYRRQMGGTADAVDRALAKQEKAIRDLEDQLRKSSGAMGNTLRGLAGAFAGAFSVQQVIALADSFTRLQNSLSVAGLEGQDLADVQQRLLELSGQNGVAIEGLAGLYGGIARAQKELGASSEQLLALTQATAESLRITGTSSQQASGAILGLTQALSAGTVRAEEYNQILEGGLQPLLQAVANTEKYGGSLARLRTAVNDGAVSSQELYQGVLANAAGITETASRATLTLSGAFEALRSNLVVYVGEADKANGVSAALAAGMKGIADNLDILIPALAVIGGVILTRYVAGLAVAAAGQLVVARNAVIMAAAAAGASRQLQVAALSARFAGGALLTAFGGPVGVAILAVGAALAYVTVQSRNAEAASAQLSQEFGESVNKLDALISQLNAAGVATDALTASARAARLELARLQLVRETPEGQTASARIAKNPRNQSAITELQLAETRRNNASTRATQVQSQIDRLQRGPYRDAVIGGLNEELQSARATVALQNANIAALRAAIDNGVSVDENGAPTSSPAAETGRTPRARTGRQGTDADAITERFSNELNSLAQQTLQARSQLATTAEEEAELARRSVELARRQALQGIEGEEDYSAERKERLRLQVEALAGYELERIARDEALRLEDEANDLRAAQVQGQTDALRAQLDLADNSAARHELALRIFDLEEAERQSILERQVANEALSQAIRDRAAAELAGIRSSQSDRREGVSRANEGPAARFMRELSKSREAINEDLENIAVDGLSDLNDGIADAITGAKSLGDAFKDVANSIINDLIRIAIQQAIIKPLTESLFGGTGGGGGGFNLGSVFGSLFGGGRASGGFVGAGKMYRVNEGASPGRVEGFMPTGSGKILPLGQMNAMAGGSGGGGTQSVALRISLDNDMLQATVVETSAQVSVAVMRANAPGIVNDAVSETSRQFGRARL